MLSRVKFHLIQETLQNTTLRRKPTRLSMSFLKRRLFAPLYGSFMALILLLLVQEGLSIAVAILKQRTVDRVTQTFQIKREAERLLGAALEEKVALRGYLISQQRSLLEQYQLGREEFYQSLELLSQLLADSPSQQDNLQAIAVFHKQWESTFVRPILTGALDREHITEEDSLDPLRLTVERILTYERSLLNEQNRRLASLDSLNQLSLSLSLLSIALIIVGSGLNFILLRRRVAAPIQELIKVGQAWKTGQLSEQIAYASEDEIGHLSATLNQMARDVRGRQEQIEHRNRQLEDLISTLSHDLRTPLLANRSTLDAAIGGAFGPMQDTLRDLLGEYRDANSNLITLVETLLDISRYEAQGNRILNHDVLDWGKICDRVMTWIQKSSDGKCRLEVCIAPDLPVVHGDSIAIQRVLQNLVDNAVRLSQPNQPVIIEITSVDLSQVRVAVHDQGPGLKEQELSTLFYRFSQGTGRQGRAGLGLYLCRQIIEAHGGKIWARSVLGQGTTFWFALPIH